MSPRVRKLALTLHVTSSVGWLGAVAGFLALAVAGVVDRSPATPRAVYPAMDIETRYVIVPLAVAALITGVIQALGTTWGLVRHYWVLVKLAVTVIATGVLLVQVESVGRLAGAATTTGGLAAGDDVGARASLVVHSGGGLLVLLVPTVLSVFKPRGLTAYGWRTLSSGGGAP